MADKLRGMKKGLTRYGDEKFSLFLRKAFIKAMGYSDDALSKPIIGITNTYSAYNACHGTVPQLIEAIKRGVMLAGGLPMEFPVISLHESFSHPTSMFLRNLMSMDTEELIRAQPMDAVVLVGGCDKTVPALLMGAASAGVPSIMCVTGPMLTGSHRGERLGACTDCRRMWAMHRAGELDEQEIEEVGSKLVPSAGSCGVMGTASTMALMTETLGMMLPGGAAIPAVLGDRYRHAELTGARAVEIAEEDLVPETIMTAQSIANSLRVLHAIGGSTNGLIHMTAIAGRLGIKVDLQAFDKLGADTPVLVNLKPSGEHYMEDLHKAGGLGPILRELRPLLHLNVPTISGRTLGEEIDALPAPWQQDVVTPIDKPLYGEGGMAVLQGNLAPGGAIIKQSAASPQLMTHTGRAVVFESLEDMTQRIDSEDLDVSADDVLVLRNAGPKGAPGMPEAGYIPIPQKLARAGVKDMVRISDARMSGTAFGTIVLHISPESAAGGPLALIKNGDEIKLDVPGRTLQLMISDAEMADRKGSWSPPPAHLDQDRGYLKLHLDHVLQAEEGCDFDFLIVSPARDHTP
ncbi:MAG: dihydroxy-acid dehydratase [Rhodospirillaceae bacterium]|jgi:dihydroxy-acid dehydratase|nr:dihydroxy-acid dehydratase [Rhodospirillaceae bacterium]MBT4701532.1 dihydroxy-acid dehydratase [Rhodospirillaceae bacterium]MBT5034067.1 dihydroxy-acid dehydratase [Rhodospirillaceae bacterium]MBT6218853.1 dihydroxy-acid dehydratase [Rhodospirillaceae bacterium]MBT6364453.1 dihydroxy-acid dehydratase [Rhodospirillaceae bacterium]